MRFEEQIVDRGRRHLVLLKMTAPHSPVILCTCCSVDVCILARLHRKESATAATLRLTALVSKNTATLSSLSILLAKRRIQGTGDTLKMV